MGANDSAVVFTAVLTLSVLLSIGGAAASENQQCTACKDGSPQTAPPDKAIDVPAFGRRTCSEIDSYAAYVPASSDACFVIQSSGSLCGCPVAENACRLCSGDDAVHAVPWPNVTLEGVFFSDFVAHVQEPVSDDYINCEMLEAVLHSHEQDSHLCVSSQYEYAELCGCQAPGGSNPGDTISSQAPHENSNTTSLPSEFSQCSLCPDGSKTKVLNRTVDLGSTIPVHDCIQLATLADLLSAEAAQCSQIRHLGTYCGCPVPEGACSFCANGDSVPYPDTKLDWFYGEQAYPFLSTDDIPESLRAMGEDLTCELMQSSLHGLDLEQSSPFSFGFDTICLSSQLKSPICGCKPLRRAVVIFWAFRLLAILSLLGSALILYDILSQPKKIPSTYHQLVIGVCSFDIISSMAYALVGVLFPESSGFYQAHGNQSTCKLQAFMLQLGLTSMFYNVLLSLYYLLVIKYNWKEFRFKKYRIYAHAAVIVFGFVMALAAFPFYGEQALVCYVVSAPRAESEVPITIFYTIPLSMALAFVTAANVAVCWTVYQQEKKALRWRLRQSRGKMGMTKKVVWQSLFYAASFYFTIPLAIVVYYMKYPTAKHFSIALSLSAISASQGFLNALVYFYRSSSLFCGWRLPHFKSCAKPEENSRKTSVAVGETETHMAPTNIDQSRVRGGCGNEMKQENDSPGLDEGEHRDEDAADPALQEEITDGAVASDVFDSGLFEAAAEHWHLTKDDGKLRRPTLRLLKRFSSLGAFNEETTQVEPAITCTPEQEED